MTLAPRVDPIPRRIRSQCSRSWASIVNSRTLLPSPPAPGTRSTPCSWPPASAITAVSLPRGSLRASSSTRIVTLYCALTVIRGLSNQMGRVDARGAFVCGGAGRDPEVGAASLVELREMAAKHSKDDAPELFLIDGNSLAYRAFFALPESIATADGRPTNAIYGLASMLVKIIDEHHPQGVVVAWDAGMSGREVTYDLYKAGRKPRPDLLREQWPHLMPLVEAFGYTNVKVEGYEADDVIASLTRQAREEGIPVMVVTGDRDAYQLVGPGVRVMSTSRGITETKIYDSDAVLERYGVPPELITDLMGLRGDTSDNIPGVPGIGEKTATQLLQQFGTLEKVLESVDEISGAKRKQNLVEHADDARMSKQLATLQYDLETGVDIAAAMASEPDRGALREFMREFELRAVMERLEEALSGGDAVPGRKVETELEVEAVQGGVEDIGAGPVAIAVEDDHWAAADEDRTVVGTSSRDE